MKPLRSCGRLRQPERPAACWRGSARPGGADNGASDPGLRRPGRHPRQNSRRPLPARPRSADAPSRQAGPADPGATTQPIHCSGRQVSTSTFRETIDALARLSPPSCYDPHRAGSIAARCAPGFPRVSASQSTTVESPQLRRDNSQYSASPALPALLCSDFSAAPAPSRPSRTPVDAMLGKQEVHRLLTKGLS